MNPEICLIFRDGRRILARRILRHPDNASSIAE
jgi:hypothetical protein